MEQIYIRRQTATMLSQFIYFGLARYIYYYEKNMSVLAKNWNFLTVDIQSDVQSALDNKTYNLRNKNKRM